MVVDFYPLLEGWDNNPLLFRFISINATLGDKLVRPSLRSAAAPRL
jgi:hypothetical protein